jgi:hypothetical protein
MKMVPSKIGGVLGVVTEGSSKFAGQARFAPVSATSVVAPLMVYQAVHMIVGTQQINAINRRLASVEQTLDRIVQRTNARELGEVIAAASTLRDILEEHRQSGHFNSQMCDRFSHCETALRAHSERLKLLKAQFHGKLRNAKNRPGHRDRAIRLASLIKEESDQFGQDVRLLVALCSAVIQLEQGLMSIALEHHPETLPHRQKQLNDQIKQCKETLQDIADLSEVQDEVRGCLDQMSWWQKHVLDRSGTSLLKEASNIVIEDYWVEPTVSQDGNDGGMLIWMDADKTMHVRSLSAVGDTQPFNPTSSQLLNVRSEVQFPAAPNTKDTQLFSPVKSQLSETKVNALSMESQASLFSESQPKRGWPLIQFRVHTPSRSIVVGETYMLIEPNINDVIPVKVLDRRDDDSWLGVRPDIPEAYVEITLKRS